MALASQSKQMKNTKQHPQGDYEESFGQSKSIFSALEPHQDPENSPSFQTQKNLRAKLIEDPSSAQTAKFKNDSQNEEESKFAKALIESFEDTDKKIKTRRQKTGEFAPKTDEETDNPKKDNSKGAVLIEIAIQPDQIETLTYREGDFVKEKALEFCRSYGLDEAMARYY